jgi:hypothetical protein
MNALINRGREFYSTRIHDLTQILSDPLTVGGNWSPNILPHLSLAAATIISRSLTPAPAPPAAIPGQYDYYTFFFEDIFRSGLAPVGLPPGAPGNLKAGAMANLALPGHFFHLFGRHFPPPVVPPVHLSFSGNWRATTGPVRSVQSEAHAERAFFQFLGTPSAAPLNTQTNLINFLHGNVRRRNIIAFIIHFKNECPMCELCRSDVANRIVNHFLGLLQHNAHGVVALNGIKIAYDDLYKGAHLVYPPAPPPPAPPPPAGLTMRGGGVIPWGTVIFPMAIPLPLVAAPNQFVRIVFIAGNDFKNVDIFE